MNQALKILLKQIVNGKYLVLFMSFSTLMSAQDCVTKVDIEMVNMPSQTAFKVQQYDEKFVDYEMYNTSNGKVYMAEIDDSEPSMSGSGMTFVFNENGEVVASGSKEKVALYQVPVAIDNYIKKNYSSNELDDIEKYVFYTGVFVYEIDFHDIKGDLIFDMEGNLICID
jgi:hypothetical protein